MKYLLLLIPLLVGCGRSHRFSKGDCYYDYELPGAKQILNIGKFGYIVGSVGSSVVFGELTFTEEYRESVIEVDCEAFIK